MGSVIVCSQGPTQKEYGFMHVYNSLLKWETQRRNYQAAPVEKQKNSCIKRILLFVWTCSVGAAGGRDKNADEIVLCKCATREQQKELKSLKKLQLHQHSKLIRVIFMQYNCFANVCCWIQRPPRRYIRRPRNPVKLTPPIATPHCISDIHTTTLPS